MPDRVVRTVAPSPADVAARIDAAQTLARFAQWLARFGETSWDHQSFYAGRLGGRAKSLYYRQPIVGVAAVTPLVALEAFLPSMRVLFHRRLRFPIADAHYAMGFAYWYEATGDAGHLDSAVHFLEALQRSRCPDFPNYCWGYPFDWVTRQGTIPSGTPLITTTPYVYEAFLAVDRVAPRAEWKTILESIVRHALADIKDYRFSSTGSSCSYTPFDHGGVINAAAYRAFLLTSAARVLEHDECRSTAERNLSFVLECQNADGSWPYAVDGVRDFVDHFHTCFVLKAIAKIHTLTGDRACLEALVRGVRFYMERLFDADGLPRPFSKAPRLTVYKRELYDCAECINLCLLLRDRLPLLEQTLRKVLSAILRDWTKNDGSFRSRRLFAGWDNVPMHRWGQSQMFRSLSLFILQEAAGT